MAVALDSSTALEMTRKRALRMTGKVALRMTVVVGAGLRSFVHSQAAVGDYGLGGEQGAE